MQIGDCDYGVCGDCYAIDLVTVTKRGWLLLRYKGPAYKWQIWVQATDTFWQ